MQDFAFVPPQQAQASPVSPLFSKAARLAEKRSVVAEWLYAMTGAAVPTDSDEAFRSSLSDGVTLCRLLNTLQPGTIPRVRARLGTGQLKHSLQCSSACGGQRSQAIACKLVPGLAQ